MSTGKTNNKEDLEKMQFGCKNKLCENLFSKYELNFTRKQFIQDLKDLCISSPEQYLLISQACYQCTSNILIGDPEKITPADITDLFSSPFLLSFLSNPVNWSHFQTLYSKIHLLIHQDSLNSNWLDHCLSLWPTSLQYNPNAIFLILFNPYLSPTTISSIAFLIFKHSLHSNLSILIDQCSVDTLQRLNNSVQKTINSKFLSNFEDLDFENFVKEMEFLQMLYDSNERVQRIPFQCFYLETLNIELNLKVEFKIWFGLENKEKKSFFCYPWGFNTESKALMLFQEIREKIIEEIRNDESGFAVFEHLVVNRTNLMQDTFSQIEGLNLKKPLKVHFIGEEGVDEGGVKKEFFQIIIRELFSKTCDMFIYYEEQRRVWFNPSSFASALNFEFVGKILGLAVYNSIILDINLPLAAYKKILNVPVSIEDLSEFDPQLVKGLQQLLDFEGDVEKVFCRQFCVDIQALGHIQTHDLIPEGRFLPVTNENRARFVQLYIDWWLTKGIQPLFNSFKSGFLSICNGKVLQTFRPAELELLVCGNPVLDFYALQKNTKYEGFTSESLTVKFFWEILHSFSEKQQKQFLCFVSGSDRAPIGGLGKMQMTVSRSGAETDRLMTAHTCFNYLVLPEYKNKEKMESLMIIAIENASGFGLM